MKILTIFALFVVAISSAVAQSGARMLGFDAMSMGRAGTSIGIFDSYESMMTNPAGLSFMNKSNVGGNLSLLYPIVKFENDINKAEGEKNIFPMPSAGYVKKSSDEDSRFTWGIGMFTQGGMGADFILKNEMYRVQAYVANTQNTGYEPFKENYIPQDYHSQFAVMQFGPSLAYKITDDLSVGLSLHAIYSTMEFAMPFGMNPSVMQGQPLGMPTGFTFGQMFSMEPALGGFGYKEVVAGAKMTELNVVTWGGKIGFAYKLSDKLSCGLNFTVPSKLDYKKGKATMDMSKQFEDAFGRAIVGFYQNPATTGAPLDTALKYVGMNFAQMGIDLSKGAAAEYDVEVILQLPMAIGYGMAYRATDKLRLSFDLEWMNWADAFDVMEIKLTNGTNDNVNAMIGSTDFNIDFPLKWKDAITLKVGGEYDLSNYFTLRLGYAYGNNPVPASTVFPIFSAIVEHHLTLGASQKLSDNIIINAAFETGLNKKLTASNPSEVQSEFSKSIIELSTIIGHISFSWNF